jgi:hypothetical protein
MSKTYKKRKQKAGNKTVFVRNRNPHTNGIGKPTKTVRLHKTPKDITRPSLKCSPFAKKNKVVSNSCFTKEAVQEMVHTFNNSHPNIPISNTTSTINQYHELNKKAEKCSQEDSCLLDSMPLDDSKKTKWREQLFVPKKPSDWNKDPNAWLSNFDISKVLNQYEKAFPYFHSIGPSSVDYDAKRNADNCVCNSLCNLSIEHEWNRGIRKLGIVFNESEHDKDGTHWVAFFIDLEDNFIFFFNSVGNYILPQMVKFKNKVIKDANLFFRNNPAASATATNRKMKFYKNTFEHQKSNTECGMYCLYFILACLLRQKDILIEDPSVNKMTVQELVQYFTQQRIPDTFIEQYRNYLFR